MNKQQYNPLSKWIDEKSNLKVTDVKWIESVFVEEDEIRIAIIDYKQKDLYLSKNASEKTEDALKTIFNDYRILKEKQE